MKYLSPISGLLIFFSFILTLYDYFFEQNSLFIAGVCAWLAFILLFHTIANKALLYLLLLLTSVSYVVVYANGYFLDWLKVLSINLYLLALLIGVGFLRLIATPKKNSQKALPKGKQSLLKTYLGVHLFGSVINLSALLLVADRLYKEAKLSRLQIIVLTRAFSSDAYWSPFFVAFAAAITYAPNLNILLILIFGLFLATIAFFVSYFEVLSNKEELESFKGYPIEFETLYLPLTLAFLVLLTHYFFQDIKIIVLISSFSLLLTLIILPFKFKNPVDTFFDHISSQLPNMKNEIALFLVAGAFGVMISSILLGLNIEFPFETLNGFTASLLLLIFILLSFVGIHPVISIAVVGNWMGELNHTLLAVTFLMSWATAVSTSPFSGLNLTMQSRYKLRAVELFTINIVYTLKMYCVCVVLLFALCKLLQVL